MATTYGRKKNRKNNVFYTVIAVVLICAVFLAMVNFFYVEAENEAYEMLHLQTKQIKDDLTLQIKSDRENLITMAHFAAKLYADGESYDRMFASFKSIGLISNIGILNPDNTFVTKAGMIDLSGKISFREEAKLGAHITGRVKDLTRKDSELVRTSVPIQVDGETVGILYGVIDLKVINGKYNRMAQELDAQLFVWEKESGNYIIDSVHKTLGNISELATREYNDGYTYEQMISSEKGYTSFRSIYKDEDLLLHYSTIDDFGWGIMLARYDSQVFEKTHRITNFMLVIFLLMFFIIIAYFLFIFENERKETRITSKASETRKLLLEINQKPENITEALKNVMDISRSRSAFFVDTEGEDFNFADAERENYILSGEKRKYFISELFRYALEFKNTNFANMCVMSIKRDAHLYKTNHTFYEFLHKHGIERVTFAAVSHQNNNNVAVLGVVNPRQKGGARTLVEEIAVCFSIALYNRKHLNKTYTAATTDSLTNVSNRVTYKKDLAKFDEEKPTLFTCIYIDVNELHLRNNRYGHAAGDEMLIYIANALKNVFYGQNIYRMGGDEFLVFAKNTELETVKRSLEIFTEQLDAQDYHVAIGVSHRAQNTNTEEMVREAEIRMYEAKADYYQNKESSTANLEDKSYVQAKTGIREIDTMLSVLKEHYNGIYRVSLDTDHAHRILMPAYLGYHENEAHFSKLLARYTDEIVHPDFRRAVYSFLNYDAIKRQIAEGKTPRITYKKVNGELVILSVYQLDADDASAKDVLWVFSKG